MPPVSNVPGFTYRDGATYLEILYALRDYILNTIEPGMNAALADALTKFQAGIANAEAVTTAQGTDWDNRFAGYNANFTDQVKLLNTDAVAAMVSDTTTSVHANLLTLIDTEIANQHSYTDNAVAAAETTLRGETAQVEQTLRDETDAKVAPTLKTWQPNHQYAEGDEVLSPDGDVVTAFRAHTSGTAYNADNWYGDFGYLMATFGGNQGVQVEKLALHFSVDGKLVFAGTNNPRYTPASTRVSGLRDPSVKFYKGRWYCAHTINTGVDKTVEIAVSDDLVNWSLNCTIQLANVVTNAWAPEFTVDDDGSMLIHYTNVDQTGAESRHTTWWIRSLNDSLTQWTAPVQQQYLGLTAVRPIDPTLIKANNGTWHVFYGNDGSIEHATAVSPTATWNVIGTGNWAGFSDNSQIHFEGPEIIQVAHNRYRIYLDEYVSPNNAPVGYYWSETSDFATWTPIQKAGRAPGFPFDNQLRHGSWVKLHSKNHQELAMAATVAAGPRRIIHGEYLLTGSAGAGAILQGNLVQDNGKTTPAAVDFFSISGQTVTVLQTGLYSVRIAAPNTEPLQPIGGGYLSVKGPIPNTQNRKIYLSQDIPANALAATADVNNLFLTTGDQFTVEMAFGNNAVTNFTYLLALTCTQQ